MSDSYLSFVNSAWGRRLAQAIGLPQPLALQRHRSGQQGLANPVIIAGAGRLADEVRRLFKATDTVPAQAATLKAPSTVKVQGAVFDASAVVDLKQLDELYEFFHANARRLGPHARVVVLGTAPEHCQDLPQAIAQRALEGLVRSLAKELRRAITVQLIYVAPGAEQSLDSSLRFFLSRRSAYVSGQVVRLEKPVDAAPAINWDKPFSGPGRRMNSLSQGGQPIDVAETIAWLAHPASGGVNGQVVRIIDPPPSRNRLLLDGLLAMRKPRLEGAPTLPRERLVRSAVELSAHAIAAYGRACGFRREQGVPLSYPHVLAFPLHLMLLTRPSFPYPASGMVHLANRIRQHRRLQE
eukprot:gene11498-11292_t